MCPDEGRQAKTLTNLLLIGNIYEQPGYLRGRVYRGIYHQPDWVDDRFISTPGWLIFYYYIFVIYDTLEYISRLLSICSWLKNLSIKLSKLMIMIMWCIVGMILLTFPFPNNFSPPSHFLSPLKQETKNIRSRLPSVTICLGILM